MTNLKRPGGSGKHLFWPPIKLCAKSSVENCQHGSMTNLVGLENVHCSPGTLDWITISWVGGGWVVGENHGWDNHHNDGLKKS